MKMSNYENELLCFKELCFKMSYYGQLINWRLTFTGIAIMPVDYFW